MILLASSTGMSAPQIAGLVRYSKRNGVRYVFGAHDPHADRLHGRLRAHKNGEAVLGFHRQIRMRYDPRLRIYLNAENLSMHKTPAIRQGAANGNLELVFNPAYANFLNRGESLKSRG
jgi:hypothetical protein